MYFVCISNILVEKKTLSEQKPIYALLMMIIRNLEILPVKMKPLIPLILVAFSNFALTQEAIKDIYEKQNDIFINSYISQQIDNIASPFDEEGELILEILKDEERNTRIWHLSNVIDYAISNGSKLQTSQDLKYKGGAYAIPIDSKLLTFPLLLTNVWNIDYFENVREEMKNVGLSLEGLETIEKIVRSDDTQLKIAKNTLAELNRLERLSKGNSEKIPLENIKTFYTNIENRENFLYFQRAIDLINSLSIRDQVILTNYLFDVGSGITYVPSGSPTDALEDMGKRIASGEFRESVIKTLGELKNEKGKH